LNFIFVPSNEEIVKDGFYKTSQSLLLEKNYIDHKMLQILFYFKNMETEKLVLSAM
jgi:hypothetical protein